LKKKKTAGSRVTPSSMPWRNMRDKYSLSQKALREEHKLDALFHIQ
jgi:hypothetical protein